MGPLTIFVAAPLVGLNLLDPVKAIGAFPGKKGHILCLAYNFGGFAHLPETYPVKFSCPRARVKGAWRMCVHQREWGETRAPCNPRTEQDGGVALLPSPGRTFQREPRNQGTQSNTCTASLRSASRAHTRQSPYGFVNVGTLQGQVALTFTRFPSFFPAPWRGEGKTMVPKKRAGGPKTRSQMLYPNSPIGGCR